MQCSWCNVGLAVGTHETYNCSCSSGADATSGTVCGAGTGRALGAFRDSIVVVVA